MHRCVRNTLKMFVKIKKVTTEWVHIRFFLDFQTAVLTDSQDANKRLLRGNLRVPEFYTYMPELSTLNPLIKKQFLFNFRECVVICKSMS